MGNLCCAREHSVQFFVQFFLHSEAAQFNSRSAEACRGLYIYCVHIAGHVGDCISIVFTLQGM
jgi:hypothetical protein